MSHHFNSHYPHKRNHSPYKLNYQYWRQAYFTVAVCIRYMGTDWQRILKGRKRNWKDTDIWKEMLQKDHVNTGMVSKATNEELYNTKVQEVIPRKLQLFRDISLCSYSASWKIKLLVFVIMDGNNNGRKVTQRASDYQWSLSSRFMMMMMM